MTLYDADNLLHKRLWQRKTVDCGLPIGNSADYHDGYTVGFFIAEGNYEYGRRVNLKHNAQSAVALSRWSKHHGYDSIDSYVASRNNRTPIGLKFSCGLTDIKRGYIGKLNISNPRVHSYNNIVTVFTSDKNAIRLIHKYVIGTTSHDKGLTTLAFNRSISFLRGVLDGILNGDGSYSEHEKRWKIGITSNTKLTTDIMVICKILGLCFSTYNYKCSAQRGGKKFDCTGMSIREYNDSRNTQDVSGFAFRKVLKVEDIGNIDVYDISVESIGNPTWDHLYSLANGILTHNSTVMPGGNAARYTRPRRGFEYLWHFGKTTKVKADTRPILMKYSQGTMDQMADVARRQTHDFRITPSGHNWDVDRMCKDRGGATPLNYLVASFNDATAEHMLKWKAMGLDIHPARYPEDLVAFFVDMLTKPGDLVCDPFSGSGTTAAVCRKLERHYICGDVAPEYVRAGKIRVSTVKQIIHQSKATWKTFDEFES
jgi:hypothetical protein